MVAGSQGFFALLFFESLKGSRFALEGVDALGLFAGFVDREGEAAVLQFFVHLDAGGGEEDHGGAFDVVFFGLHAPGGGVFAGAGDGEFAFGLEEFECLTGPKV